MAAAKLKKVEGEIKKTEEERTRFIANLPLYLQQCLELYENDFSYHSEGREKIAKLIADIGTGLGSLQKTDDVTKEYLMFFTDALALNHADTITTMLDAISHSIQTLSASKKQNAQLSEFLLAVLDPLGDSFEVTSAIRANHTVQGKYLRLLTDLCKRYVALQGKTIRPELAAPAMPKPLLGKIYHVFRAQKRASAHGELHWRYQLSYGLQACRRIESDESSSERRRRRIWDLVSVVSGSGGYIEEKSNGEDSSRTTFQVAPEKLAEAFHIKVRKAEWYDKIERAETEFHQALVADQDARPDAAKVTERLIPLSHYGPHAVDWQFAYGLGDNLIETVESSIDELKNKKIKKPDDSFIDNLVVFGQWMAYGFPLGTTFDEGLRKSLKADVRNKSYGDKFRPKQKYTDYKDDDVAKTATKILSEIFGKITKKVTKQVDDSLKQRAWKITFSILYHQIRFYKACNIAMHRTFVIDDPSKTNLIDMLEAVDASIDVLSMHWEKNLKGIREMDDIKSSRQKSHYSEKESMHEEMKKLPPPKPLPKIKK